MNRIKTAVVTGLERLCDLTRHWNDHQFALWSLQLNDRWNLSVWHEPAPDTAPLENSDETLHGVHPADTCAGDHCTIHNRSDHHMRGWPQHWRDDRALMERICPHGIGHPDPDEINPNTIHGCDGCCIP